MSLKPTSGFFALQQPLATDTKYTVTAQIQVGSGASATQEQASSAFTTVTTPKVTATTPQQIGDGQSITVTLDQPAKAISADGPVQATLAADGTTVTVVPQTLRPGRDLRLQTRHQEPERVLEPGPRRSASPRLAPPPPPPTR